MLLPSDRDRALATDAGSWTSSAQVTATGCVPGSCATATGDWAPSDSGRGVLRSTVTGTAGHAGQAAVTWRSGIFAGPPAAGRTIWTLALADRRAVAAPSTNATSIYTVRILDQATGTGRTIVDRAPVPASDGPLVPSAPVTLPAASIVAGATYRLEITIRIPFGASAGDGSVELAGPQLAVEPAAIAATPTPPAPPASLLPTPLPGPGPAAPQGGDTDADTTDADTNEADPTERDALSACLDDDRDLAIVGASAAARRLTVEGHADAEPGSHVEIISADGWKLGRTVVDADGLFSATLPEPRGSAGIRRVFARLADGARSGEVAVQRRNVVTGHRWSERRVEVRGTLAADTDRRGRLSAVLDLSGGDPCDLTRHVRANRFDLDRRTGAYRAVFTVQEIAIPAGKNAVVPVLVRINLTRSGVGSVRRTLTSQVIFGPTSDRRGT